MRASRFLIGVVAFAMPLTTMSTVIGMGVAWASTGTGHFTCKSIRGTVSFRPPLTNGGTLPETTTVHTTARDCSGTAVPKPAQVIGSATIRRTTNSCTGLAGAPPNLTVSYSPVVTDSTYVFTSETVQTTPHLGLTLGGGIVTGSYPNSAHNTSVKIQTNETLMAFDTACASPGGVQDLIITSGVLRNG